MAGALSIYKRNQGQVARSLTAVGLGLMLAAICYYVSDLLGTYVAKPDAREMALAETSEEWVLDAAWPDAQNPLYEADDPLNDMARQDLAEAGVERIAVRRAKPLAVDLYIQYGVPAAMFLLGAFGIFWAVNTPKFADFLIATESEMKKVAWSSREELIGSTAVVIVTVAIMAVLIYLADLFSVNVFKFIGVY